MAIVHSKGYGVREHFELPRAARRLGAMLYHSPHYVLPKTLRLPATVVIHDLIHLQFPEYFSWAARTYARHMIGDAYRRARRVITPSEATRRDLLERFGGEPDRVVVVPNGLDERWFVDSAQAGEGVRERFELPERFLLYSGNVKPHKNLERLVDAFAACVQSGDLRDEVLVLAGSPAHALKPLMERAQRAGVAQRVRGLGRLPFADLRSVTAAAHMFVFPSLAEGFGLPPLEAMASGVPVLAADAGAIPEVCASAAHFVDPREVDSIRAGIVQLHRDASLRASLIERGRRRAAEYSVEEMARRTVEVWREVARG